ncbi:MAG: XRE family transcriptional regulator [Pseudorhodoplanes sp.]
MTRLRELVGNESQSAFAARARISQSTFNRIWNGHLPNLGHLIDIAEAAGVSLDSLVRKGGDEDVRARQMTPIRLLRVQAEAGKPENSDQVWVANSILASLDLPAEFARAFYAAGSAMQPIMGDGDLLIVDVSARHRTDPADGQIYVFSVGEAFFVRRLRRTPSGWAMRGDNLAVVPVEEPIPPTENLVVHGRVRWVSRRL